jgi:hypothetical protein
MDNIRSNSQKFEMPISKNRMRRIPHPYYLHQAFPVHPHGYWQPEEAVAHD